ncbi:MAG: putative sugar nucleotidyl transferase [bacterium]
MRILPLLFEDHTAQNFQPLSWSVPVYELRCGLYNLRERVQDVIARFGGQDNEVILEDVGCLPRQYLLPLAEQQPGLQGLEACRRAVDLADRVLLFNARLGPRWDVLAAFCGAGSRLGSNGDGLAWFVDDELLAVCLDRQLASSLLADWAAWEAACTRTNCWQRAEQVAPAWRPGRIFDEWSRRTDCQHGCLLAPESVADSLLGAVAAVLDYAEAEITPAFEYIWELVQANGHAIVDDVQKVVAAGRSIARFPFGLAADPALHPEGPIWQRTTGYTAYSPETVSLPGSAPDLFCPESIWVGAEVRIEPGVVLDARHGPIVLDSGVRIMPQSYLEGPLYVGPGCLVKSGAKLYGETSLGIGNKVAGEVGESLFADFVNKQHDGFIGHAVLGNWVNLGAATNCSDLKNNYGTIRIDLGRGAVDSGLQFAGLLMGEHSKSAIGTLFNTGSCVGLACNVFTTGFPQKFLPNFTWGDAGGPLYEVSKAVATARTVLHRRGMVFSAAHQKLFEFLGS